MGSQQSLDKATPEANVSSLIGPTNLIGDQDERILGSTTNSHPLNGTNPNDHDQSNGNLNDNNINLVGNATGTITSSPGSVNGTSFYDYDFNFDLLGNRIYPFRWIKPMLPYMKDWVGPLASVAMVIGCVLPYIPQYVKIHKNQNSSGFSTYVCLTLLLANILRVAFWFERHYETPLLVQSIIMILLQIALLELCVRVKYRYRTREKSLASLNWRHFWQWTKLSSYLEFLSLFTALVAIVVYFFIDNKPFMDAVGYCALLTEAMLGLPQVIKNCRNRSVEGMSLVMVLLWLGGDIYKATYFIINDSPFQFWLCGLLQITIDLLILFQVCLFRQNAPIKVSSRANDSPKEMMAI